MIRADSRFLNLQEISSNKILTILFFPILSGLGCSYRLNLSQFANRMSSCFLVIKMQNNYK